MQASEVIVVGGGLLGAAIAYGAAKAGAHVTVLDQGDIAHRASRGNFGLVWVSGKGDKAPHYSRWCCDAATAWPALAQELLDLTGVDVALQQSGGLHLCMTEADLQAREATLKGISNAIGGVPFEMLDHAALKALVPSIGPKVAGASFGLLDGHCNPLKLLYALHAGLKARDVRVVSNVDVSHVSSGGNDFEVESRDGRSWRASRVVVAAGLGTKDLAAQVGLHAPVKPNRGQMLITERLRPFLPYPTAGVRQTDEGSVQLGNSFEDVGLDNGTTASTIESIAKDVTTAFPILASVRLVRAWGCLRVLTPDSLPIYQESASCPGAFVATSHSGVSLAAIHAGVLGPWMAGLAAAPQGISEFAGDRFLGPNRRISNAFLDAYAHAH
ncbi:MAG: FAD-binding oxidoreductase [Ideonella sp.]|nr:FAD-binding oxidoreductase [Ideonella sp.]